MQPLVSIIIPVYNAALYLDHCLGSLLRQTYQNVELLVIDDKSTDDSGLLCDFWAEHDARIHVFHQSTNQGVSAARNLALDNASGTFICFVDSDDWCEPDYINRFVINMTEQKVQLACCGYFADGQLLKASTNKPLSRSLTQGEMLQDIIKPSGDIRGFLWNKCYRRDIIEANHLRFDMTLTVMEDQLFNVSYIRDADTFWYDAYQTYHYVTYSNSASHGLSTKKLAAELTALDKINDVIDTSELKQSLQTQLAEYRLISNDSDED
ncbi:glycosyltransferase family 2 protein [Furfurilactobacillus siliginis]|uniref:Glycosyl transferase family 2 n=1 Tax=Furfurilactobacillus siliginis TaxID=348151 RepID=A0A0R2L415_9LACO|nr:glycosyltransferase family A protein [Furfurilactobacillus siliginis]KRN96403.1 glycosyl transferase group 2 [Furfurilactobacillus siliginis]GEK29301.1 glycosyl transferase family 2 [Furfurilactobacillus siliginis]